MSDDARLLAHLRGMWRQVDPVPPDLADRVLFALELEDLDVHWLTSQGAMELSGARTAGEETVRTITFGSDSLTVMVTLSGSDAEGHRLDGWIVPAGPLRVELRAGRVTRSVVADTTGRFAFDELRRGPVQLVVQPTEGVQPALAKAVVTPAFAL